MKWLWKQYNRAYDPWNIDRPEGFQIGYLMATAITLVYSSLNSNVVKLLFNVPNFLAVLCATFIPQVNIFSYDITTVKFTIFQPRPSYEVTEKYPENEYSVAKIESPVGFSKSTVSFNFKILYKLSTV